MLIEVPKNYKPTKGDASKLDRYLKIKIPEDDLRFIRNSMLLDHAATYHLRDRHAEWFVVAHVYPGYLEPDRLAKLDEICSRTLLRYKIFDDSWHAADAKRIEYYTALYHGGDEVCSRRCANG